MHDPQEWMMATGSRHGLLSEFKWASIDLATSCAASTPGQRRRVSSSALTPLLTHRSVVKPTLDHSDLDPPQTMSKLCIRHSSLLHSTNHLGELEIKVKQNEQNSTVDRHGYF
jgi:hypothetical protein